ncbi:uncharacterized protein A4U43_C03F17660 [Asparagus officinalis]|uniref:Uncharacterized protein n=1 Tax=Asparagus officinalis TaxID=4686 RepID=A0A5P1FFV8_ASPOF|nr:uncharacterized protein A4U43_C03F17660 [Asparagus officinalis]
MQEPSLTKEGHPSSIASYPIRGKSRSGRRQRLPQGARPKALLPAYPPSRCQGVGPWFSPDSGEGSRAVLDSSGQEFLRGFQCRSLPKPSELLGSGGAGGERDIRPDGEDPNFVSQALRGGSFLEG